MAKRKRTPPSTRTKLEALAAAALDKKAENVVSLDVKEGSGYTDYFLICSGSHARQNQAIADEIQRKLIDIGSPALGVEGYDPGVWILIDADDVVIHVFDEASRIYYDLERLWSDAAREHHTDQPAAKAAK